MQWSMNFAVRVQTLLPKPEHRTHMLLILFRSAAKTHITTHRVLAITNRHGADLFGIFLDDHQRRSVLACR